MFQPLPWTAACSTQCASGANWTCVGHVSWPIPKFATTGIDFVALRAPGEVTPIPGLHVRVCNGGDLTCASPGLDESDTDPSGRVHLQFANANTATGGVDGYLQIDPGDSGVLPYLYFWGFPLSEKDWLRAYFGFETLADWQSAAQSAGISMDPERGMIVAFVVDCLLVGAANVSVTLSNQDAGVVESNFGGTLNGPTDSTALAIFNNVPVGVTEVTATPIALGRPSSKVAVYVRKGTVTAVLLYPTPL